jgi:hypothetical protein
MLKGSFVTPVAQGKHIENTAFILRLILLSDFGSSHSIFSKIEKNEQSESQQLLYLLVIVI